MSRQRTRGFSGKYTKQASERSMIARAAVSAIESLERRVFLSAATQAADAALRAELNEFFLAEPSLGKAFGGNVDKLVQRGVRPIDWQGETALAQEGQWIIRLPEAQVGKDGSLAKARAELDRHRKATLPNLDAQSAEQLRQISIDKSLGERFFLIKGPAALDHAKAKGLLKGMAGAATLEPNFLLWADLTPNDPSFSTLWGLHNTGQSGGKIDADIDAPEAWDLFTGSSSVVVGVIDTGINYSHPDLAANIWTNPGETAADGIDNDANGYVDDVRGWDFVNNDSNPTDDHQHGTHVAGTIGAAANNAAGVAGVAHNLKLMALKFLDASGSGTTDGAIAAVNYATKMRRDHGINLRLTNNSWGGTAFSQALKDAIALQAAQQMLFVAAAGNDTVNTDFSPQYPSAFDLANIVSVASTDRYDNLSAFSNYGKVSVDLAAPGSEIYSTVLGTGYGSLSGTSMASPHVAGALALLHGFQPSLTADQMKQRLLQRVDPLASLKDKVLTGGRLNLFKLLDPNWTPTPADLDLAAVTFADAAGNNDRLANPGEQITLLPALFNGGQQTATGVTVEIVLPAGATIIGSTSRAVADITSTATASPATAFGIQLASTLVDGQKITFQFIARYNGTVQETFSHQLTISRPSPTNQVSPGFTIGEMLADRTRNIVYILDQTNKKVVAIDTAIGRTVAHANLAGTPSGLAASPDGTELYVSSYTANKIEVFSMPDLFPVRTLNVPTPGLLAVGVNNRLYLAGDNYSGTMRQVNALTGEVLLNFGQGYGGHVVANAAGTRLFTSALGWSTTSTDEYDISVAGAPVFKKTHGTNMSNGREVAIDEQYNRLYSMSGGVYGVYVVDMTANTGATWSFGGAPYGAAVATHPSVDHIWGGSQASEGLFRFDRATGTRTGNVVAGDIADRGVKMTGNSNVLFKRRSGTTLGILGTSSLVVASIPVARFTASQPTGSPGLTVSFDGTISQDYELTGTIVSWTWNFGDNTTGTGSTVNHTFTTPGTYTVKLTVQDGQGFTDDFERVIKVSDPPVAQPQSVSTNEDQPKSITLQASDPNLDPLTYVIVTPPAHGTIAQNGAQVTYTPHADYFGPDSFTFKANDGRVDGNVATVSITVNAVNDAPRAIKDTTPISASGGSTTIAPLANDFDVEGDDFAIVSFTQPTRGSVTRAGDQFTYTPTRSFQGFDTFTYTVQDEHGAQATGEISIASGVAVLDGEWTTYGNSAARVGYLGGFLGTAEPIPGWTLPIGYTNGRQVTSGGGRIYVVDDDGFSNQKLTALNPANGQKLWELALTVGNSGDGLEQPTYYEGVLYLRSAVHSASQMMAVNAATGAILWQAANSTQWDNYVAPAVGPKGIWGGGGYYGGMQGWRFDGSQITFIYGPQTDGWGPAIYNDDVYRLTAGRLYKYASNGSAQWDVAVAHIGTVPVLAHDSAFIASSAGLQAIKTSDGTTRWTTGGSFLGNAAVANGVVYAISGMTVRSYNALTGAAVRTYTATETLADQPIVTDDALFVASSGKTFVFSIQSGQLLHTLNDGGRVALAGNRLYVTKSDGSVKTYFFAREENEWPTANADSATTAEETAVTINVAANDTDPDGDPVKATAVSTAAHGTTVLNVDGSITYTPAKDYFGPDSFTYTVVDEKGGKATGTVNVTVTPVNDAPTAPNKTVYVATAVSSPIQLAATDIDGDTLTYTITEQPLHGTLSGNGPVFTFTPEAGFTGSDTFFYKVNDGKSDSGVGIVTIFVDDPPTAINVDSLAREDVANTIALQGTDPNGDPLIYQIVTGPAHGTASVSGRYLTYRPVANYFGPDTITFRVSDGIMTSGNATLSITVLNVNDAPVAQGDNFAAPAGGAVLSPVLFANDTDIDSDTLSIVGLTQPANGTVALFGGGRVVYTPNAGFQGLDQFTYTVSDGNGGTATATAAVSIGQTDLDGDWTTFGNGSAHAGYFPGSVVGGSFLPGWSTTFTGVGLNPLTIADGRVYVSSSYSAMFVAALDEQTGQEEWRRVLANGSSLNQATYYNGRLYVQRGNHGSDTQLWAINATDGAPIWNAPFSAQWESYYAPAVHASGVWINGGYYGGMYGFTHAGSQIKFVGLAQYDEWTPSILGDNVYSYVAGGFSKHDLAGNVLWTHTKPWSWSGWSMNRVSALSGTRGYMIGNPDLYAVNLADGTGAWTVPGNFYGSPAIANGKVYAIAGNQVKSFNAATGGPSTVYTADASILSQQPIVTDDALLVSSNNATYIFHLDSGALMQKLDKGGQLSLANGVLYVASGGTVYTYRLTAPLAAPSAPDLDAASDTGESATDNVTGDSTPTFSGTAAPGATVTLFSDGAAVGTGVADAGGAWSITAAALGAGTHSIRAAILAGPTSSSALSGALDVTIDSSALAASGGYAHWSAQGGHQIKVKFNRNVVTLDPSDLVLTNLSTGQSIDNVDAVYDAEAREATFTFPDHAAALPNGHYRATLAASGVEDADGNTLAGDYVIEFVTATGGSGADNFRLRLTGNGTTAEITSGVSGAASAAAVFTCPIDAIDSFLFQGMGGDDVLDFDGPFDQPVLFNGGGGNDTLNVNAGTYTFDADAKLLTAGLAVNVTSAAAAVRFNATQHLRALNIAAGVASMPAGAGLMLVTDTFSITGGGKLDLADNDMIVHSGVIGGFDGSAYDGVTGAIAAAYNFSAWDGNGLLTSMSDAAAGLTSLAVATGTDLLGIAAGDTATWQGEQITGSSILIKYTYAGDLNLDGLVDAADYGVIDNWIQFPGTWAYGNGDFNFDGIIDAGDYGIIDNSIQMQGAPL